MKLVLFQSAANGEILPGLMTDRGVVDISGAVKKGYTPQLTMQGIIDDFDRLKPALEKLAAEGKAVPAGQVQLKPPLPRPGKILCCIANYWEHAQREARPLNMFMKNPDAVVGPGDTIMLPEYTVPWAFMHEAELALVIKGPAKMVKQKDWKSAVFGYTTLIDVSARELGRRTWPAIPLTSWLGKSFDTFAPIGPCIATADEVKDPNDLIVRFWDDGVLRHNYNTDDMEHRVPELVEWATTVMTMNSGDLIACGTNHEGLGFLQDGETVDIEIQHIGKMTLKVRDPLKRTWEKGVYMGVDFDQSGRGEAPSPAGRRDRDRRDLKMIDAQGQAPGIAEEAVGRTLTQRRDAGLRDLLVLVRLHAGHADRADAFALMHDRHAALEHHARRRERHEARPLLDAVLEELARPLGERGGLRLAHRDRRRDRAGAVQAFEQQRRAAVIDDGDGDGPFVLLRFGFAGGHHLVTVGRRSGRVFDA